MDYNGLKKVESLPCDLQADVLDWNLPPLFPKSAKRPNFTNDKKFRQVSALSGHTTPINTSYEGKMNMESKGRVYNSNPYHNQKYVSSNGHLPTLQKNRLGSFQKNYQSGQNLGINPKGRAFLNDRSKAINGRYSGGYGYFNRNSANGNNHNQSKYTHSNNYRGNSINQTDKLRSRTPHSPNPSTGSTEDSNTGNWLRIGHWGNANDNKNKNKSDFVNLVWENY